MTTPRCDTFRGLMSNRQSTKRTETTADLDPASLARYNLLKRQRQRIARTLLKRRRQKSHQ